jgi:hypothetical protein
MTQRFQYKAGEQISNEAGDNTRFDLQMAEEVAGEIARKLFGLWDWKSAIDEMYAPSGLETLANQWLRANATPALANARVVEIDYRGHASKYVSKSKAEHDNNKDNNEVNQ